MSLLQYALRFSSLLGSHTLVVGEIIETHITDNCMSNGKVDPERIDPLIFIPGTQEGYHCLGEAIAPAFKIGME